MSQGPPGGPPVGTGYYPHPPGGPGPYPPYGSPPSRDDSWGGRRGGGDRGRHRDGRPRAPEEFKEADPGEEVGRDWMLQTVTEKVVAYVINLAAIFLFLSVFYAHVL